MCNNNEKSGNIFFIWLYFSHFNKIIQVLKLIMYMYMKVITFFVFSTMLIICDSFVMLTLFWIFD